MTDPQVLPTNSDVFERLKVETAQAHKDIEGSIPLMNPGLDLGLYRQVLERYYGFYQPLEPQLERYLRDRRELQYSDNRRKLPLLEKDLRSLGLNDEQMKKLSVCADLPRVSDLASALGVLYVLEGSTLGGQILYRNVEKKLQINNETGASFLAAYGPQTGAMWKQFKEIAAPCLQSPEHQEKAILAARESFSLLQRWMNSTP